MSATIALTLDGVVGLAHHVGQQVGGTIAFTLGRTRPITQATGPVVAGSG